MWVLVHIAFLIGFRNRLLVLIEWAWAYVTFNRGVRLITGTTALASHSPAVQQPPGGRARAS